jgi:hypothetical protein
MNITTIGLDIAKQVFHAACCNEQGKLIKRKLLTALPLKYISSLFPILLCIHYVR